MLAGGASGPAIVPGDSGASLLIEKVSGQRGAIMPASGEPLTAAQIATLRAWIDAGAVWPETAPIPSGWVAPIAPSQPDLPAGSEPHPVDRFIAAYFAKHAIAFPAPASTMRDSPGASISTCGDCRHAAQLEAFLDDRDPDKRARLIDALLADAQPYAEHWISWWNDLLRNDQGSKYAGERKSITDWLLGALEQQPALRQDDRRAGESGGEERPGRFPDRRQLARRYQRQPDALHAGGAKHRADFSGDQSEVRLLPRQLHQPLQAARVVWHGGAVRARRAGWNWCVATSRPARTRGRNCSIPNWARCPRMPRSPNGTPPPRDSSPTRATAAWPAPSSIATGKNCSAAGWWNRWTRWMASRGTRTCSTGWRPISRRTAAI
jgi:hypothetical protein